MGCDQWEQDEMLWAAVWLFIATGGEDYKAFIAGDGNVGGAQTFFSWDNKFVGAQALVAKASDRARAANSPAMLINNDRGHLVPLACSSSSKGSWPTPATRRH